LTDEQRADLAILNHDPEQTYHRADRLFNRLCDILDAAPVVEGMRVEWGVPEGPASQRGSRREWSAPLAAKHRRHVAWAGRTIPASRIEWALLRSAEQGRLDRVDAIASTPSPGGVDPVLLDELLADHTVGAEALRHLRKRVGA
ncbi:MAG: hypothetical protein L3J96_03445, partial [Thermoplasmata archaeon]|nr:hypothetical protein [Thermoplasmata archaeon]